MSPFWELCRFHLLAERAISRTLAGRVDAGFLPLHDAAGGGWDDVSEFDS
jgi:hypothetical protein